MAGPDSGPDRVGAGTGQAGGKVGMWEGSFEVGSLGSGDISWAA